MSTTATRNAKKKSTQKKPAAPKKAVAIPTFIALADLPRIGSKLAGGIFAGIVRAESSTSPDIAIVDLGYSANTMGFDKAQKWAESQGGVAPDRAEARVVWANLDLHDEKKPSGGWFWLRTPYAGDESYAWFQYFDYGSQDNGPKGLELRARAVRRLTIQ